MTPDVLGPSAPDWLTWAFWARDPESLRNLALAVGALAAVVVGLPLLCWRTWNVHRQAKAALRQAETSAERGITESFTRAVDQLGSEKLETRLGAIYALERIAKDSQRDHWPIMETLTAYIRERAPSDADRAGQLRVTTDVQAALTVIGRRRVKHDAKGQSLQLQRTDLRGAHVVAAHLEGASLWKTHLEGAQLGEAHLERANLTDAHLEGAVLFWAHMEGASLWETHLEGAHLDKAHLEGAVLFGARLERATLEGANLKGAQLQGADLTGSDVTQEQLDHACGDENTKLPEGLSIKACAE